MPGSGPPPKCGIFHIFFFDGFPNHHHLMLIFSDLGIPEDNQSDIVQDTVGTCRPAAEPNLPKLQTVTNKLSV